jgi:protease IV
MKQVLGSAVGTFVAIFVLILCLCSMCFVTIAALPQSMQSTAQMEIFEFKGGDRTSENKILTIPINGVVLADRSAESALDLFTAGMYVYGYEVQDILETAAEDPQIKGVMLEINSPGGSPVGAQAIADGVEYYRQETGKPVYAYIGEMGASAAYWIAASADYVTVEPNGLSGSIGVLSGPFQYYNKLVGQGDVITLEGIESYYITSGESKDFGSPYRRITDEEKSQWQELVDNTYDRFVNYIATRRGLEAAFIKDQIGAYLYDSTKAVELNLVDEALNNDTTYSMLLEKAAIVLDDYQLVEFKAQSDFFNSLFGLLNQQKVESATTVCPFYTGPVAIYGDISNYCKD